MITVVELEPIHLEKIKVRKYEQETMNAFHFRLTQFINAATLGPAFAFLWGESVLAVAGIAILWGKVGEAWLLSSEDITGHGLAVSRAVRNKFDEVQEQLGLWRVQAQAPVSHETAHRWLKWVGFKDEPTLARRYSVTGEDCLIYAKVRDGD